MNSINISENYFLKDLHGYIHPKYNISHINYYGKHFTHYNNICTEEIVKKFNNYLIRFEQLLKNKNKKILFIHSNEEYIYHKFSRDNKEILYNYLCQINDSLDSKYTNINFEIINIDINNKFNDYKSIKNLSMPNKFSLSDRCENHTPIYYNLYRRNITEIIRQYITNSPACSM